MNAVVTPLHVGTVGGVPVRFFRGPSGQPELPWHAVDDLYRALGLPRAKRRFLLQATQLNGQRSYGPSRRQRALSQLPLTTSRKA